MDKVKIHEHVGSSDDNQIHFNIKVKTGKGKYKEMRTYLANIDWINLLMKTTAT